MPMVGTRKAVPQKPDVARLIGVTQTSVSRRLRGEGRWTLDEIDLLILAGVDLPVTALGMDEAVTL